MTEDEGSICEKDLIDLKVWLSDALSIQIRGRVIRIMKYSLFEKNMAELGLSTEEISEKDRANLTRYITERAIIRKS